MSGELVSGPWKEAWTAHKILSKILSDRISLVCSTFDVLQEDNFLVLKGTMTQFLIFAIGSVVKNALEKNRELWLSLVRIKMCSKFIRFFGGIHRNHTNQVMTDFGLTSSYSVHDGLDQGEESICGYRLNSHFVSKNGHSKSQAGFSSFFAAGAFVDDTIWVGSSQTATQHILNVASEFFHVNDISINNNKTVVIFINSRISNPSLSISSSPISIAKKGESHQYLGIFLLTEGFSKPSLLRLLDKQFLYLVLAVLHPIVSYKTQFSFISVGMCSKWDALIHKSLKLKSGLPLNFPNDAIQHPLFYGLKSFFQVQSESKIASLVSFVNSSGILDRLFFHRSHNLQVLCWCPVHLLSSPVRIRVSVSNNFLTGMIRVLLGCNVSLGGSLVNSFRFRGFSLLFGDMVLPLWINFVTVMRLDSCGPVPEWFKHSVLFLNSVGSFYTQSMVLGNGGPLNILESGEYVSVHNCLLVTDANSLSVYTDGSLSNLGTVGCRAGAVVFFEDISLGLGVSVSGLMLSTLVELQAIALALECVLLSSSVCLFSDSQSALDACRSELGLVCPNFCNQCWVERHHIVNLICSKKLGISFHKVKDHSGIPGNEHADAIAGATSFSNCERFLTANSGIVSGNSKHFVHNIYHSVCRAHWEIGSGSEVLVGSLFSEIDWLHLLLVWHLDLHMTMGFTSRLSASVRTYFMKALHHRLPVAVQKRFYNRHYPNVLCLYCDEVLSDFSLSSSGILQLLSSCVSDSSVSMALFKGFVFNGWFREAVCIFHDPKIAVLEIVKFVCTLGFAFRKGVWSVRAKHRAYIEKNGLIPLDGSAVISVHGLTSRFSAGVVRLLGITNALGVHFGFRKSCLFFLSLGNSVLVHIAV
ncbi:hypothetical protein G9A89_015495 [Geosiphon pyriformis]|nr:hypothetical protein G9A89_015495 [Geosiphon pyriformis]